MARYIVSFNVTADWGAGPTTLGTVTTVVKKPWWKRWRKVELDLAHSINVSEAGMIPPGSVVVLHTNIYKKERKPK